MVNFHEKLAQVVAAAATAPKKKAAPNAMQKRIKGAMKGTPKVKVPPALEKKSEEAMTIVNEIQPLISGVTITSQEQYDVFDSYLTKVIAARKEWTEDIEKILQPQRESINATHELNRKVDRPREKLENAIRLSMKGYNDGLLRLKQQEEWAKEQEKQRLAEDKRVQERLMALSNAPVAVKVAAQAKIEILNNQIDAVEQVETTQLTQSGNSGAKILTKWKVESLVDLIIAVLEEKVPIQALTVNEEFINGLFKLDKDSIKKWPGIEIYQESSIVAGKNRWRG